MNNKFLNILTVIEQFGIIADDKGGTQTDRTLTAIQLNPEGYTITTEAYDELFFFNSKIFLDTVHRVEQRVNYKLYTDN